MYSVVQSGKAVSFWGNYLGFIVFPAQVESRVFYIFGKKGKMKDDRKAVCWCWHRRFVEYACSDVRQLLRFRNRGKKHVTIRKVYLSKRQISRIYRCRISFMVNCFSFSYINVCLNAKVYGSFFTCVQPSYCHSTSLHS